MTRRARMRNVPILLLAYLLSAAPSAGGAQGYEDALTRWGLARTGRILAVDPEGQRVEAVLVAAEEVVAESDPYPGLLNALHVRTRDEVIRREVLLEVGAAYQAALAAETARNLRKLFLFAVVRVVAVQGSAPGAVALLVITKDLWSLRLNSDFAAVGSLVQLLRLQPIEQNFLGLGQQVALDFILRRDTLSVGQVYVNRRVLGSRVAFSEAAFLVFERETGKLDGSRGEVLVARPLFSLSTAWGFETQGAWRILPTRVFRGSGLWQLSGPEGDVPYVYDSRVAGGSAMVLRAFGERWKTQLGLGLGAHHRRYTVPPRSTASEAQRAFLVESYLPRSEDAAYLVARVRLFEARFEVLRDIESFALSEDYALGYLAYVSSRYAPPLARGLSHFADVGVTARYRWSWAGGLSTVSAAGAIRRAFDESPDWTHRHWAAEVHQVSPKVLGGRFVGRAFLDVNVDDLVDRVSLLGGGNGLRGAPADAYAGKRVVLANLEYRSAPWVFRTLHVGGVLFYDAGSAFDRRPDWIHSVGAGLRFLFPQFNVTVFRLDVGYVLGSERPPWGGRFSFTSGQNTEYRPELLDAPLR